MKHRNSYIKITSHEYKQTHEFYIPYQQIEPSDSHMGSFQVPVTKMVFLNHQWFRGKCSLFSEKKKKKNEPEEGHEMHLFLKIVFILQSMNSGGVMELARIVEEEKWLAWESYLSFLLVQ